MKEINKNRTIVNIVSLAMILVLIYLIISLYFINHFFIGTYINGINVSGKSIEETVEVFKGEINRTTLRITGRCDTDETISAESVDLTFNSDEDIRLIKEKQKFIFWISGVIKDKKYTSTNTYKLNEIKLGDKIDRLEVVNVEYVSEPKNPYLKYVEEGYIIVKEDLGNKLNINEFYNKVREGLLQCKKELNLDKENCYEKPKVISTDKVVLEAKTICNKYLSTKINYEFGENSEILDSVLIKNWIDIDNDYNVTISEEKVMNFVRLLSKKYNTVGKERRFKTTDNKDTIISGGYYGWRIDIEKESKELIENIKKGDIISREPIYAQKAISREEDDIGDTYIEVNLTKQYLWYYKGGKVVAQGDIVTGNESRGNGTPTGIYMLTYKERNAKLVGDNYSSSVEYWMPFNGNIGIHDASWRNSFGGNIFKSNGSHGCVNVEKYLAKKIFENIESGTPVICYKE